MTHSGGRPGRLAGSARNLLAESHPANDRCLRTGDGWSRREAAIPDRIAGIPECFPSQTYSATTAARSSGRPAVKEAFSSIGLERQLWSGWTSTAVSLVRRHRRLRCGLIPKLSKRDSEGDSRIGVCVLPISERGEHREVRHMPIPLSG